MSDTRAAKEIRLGLVLYGGVSLAVYMHGVTKELFKLVRAARAFDDAWADDAGTPLTGRPNPFDGQDGADTEARYYDALVALAAAGTPCTVAIDVIAGTSAGGINGVCLGRGLVEGRSLDEFRGLWLDEGDIDKLLEAHLFPLGRAQLAADLARSLLHLGLHHTSAPLDGAHMSAILARALAGMQPIPGQGTLVRPDSSLDLFTTATSVYGYHTAVPTGVGGFSHTDRSYRQVLQFHHDTADGDTADGDTADGPGTEFDDAAVPALAFAARATSSFPGAFPPVSIATFLDALPKSGTASAAAIERHMLYGTEFGESLSDQWYMDGGVLDNGPFDHVIDAIAAKRASSETSRELVYLEPDPGPPTTGDHGIAQPTLARAVWNAEVRIPQHTPLVDVLTRLRAMNDAIAQVGDIVRAEQAGLLATLDRIDAAAGLRGFATYEGVDATAAAVRENAQHTVARGYATYCRLRAESVATMLARTLARALGFPARSNRTMFVGAVFSTWMREQAAWSATDAAELETALGQVDIPFRLRRAEFVLQGINDLLPHAPAARQAQLREMKRATWALLTELRGAARRIADDLAEPARAIFGPDALSDDDVLAAPADFVRGGAFGHRAQLAALYARYVAAATDYGLSGSSRALWASLQENTAGWQPEERAALLMRYVGFPIWDSLIFPVIALADLPQLSPITVRRFSPIDATCLHAVDEDGERKADPSAKLAGVALAHFGGFFERTWRENDYLWGRLDGAELVLRLLTRQSGGGTDLGEILRDCFTAVLDSEGHALSGIRKVITTLREQVSRIGPGALSG